MRAGCVIALVCFLAMPAAAAEQEFPYSAYVATSECAIRSGPGRNRPQCIASATTPLINWFPQPSRTLAYSSIRLPTVTTRWGTGCLSKMGYRSTPPLTTR